ncbi:efflux transporter outer membrane subunit [Stakelama sp. CBK3Z-3]|uniref:Efflux transporter outer membrane subunit n=1 Tax=Stakelama flava TaxID=2860338 RepID=A0ABS6XKX2_9SPHN|nr:efflux transporter outer membrane subunit [Stakelama flava]MBW4330801.1 efflux transporter outer membrane subunit [Stakelama flava]
MLRKFVPGLMAATALAGCTVGPDYTPPEVETPAQFAEPAPTRSADTVDLAHWWTAFGDPQLDALIRTALADSPDVKTAASRLRNARVAETLARANYLPQVNASAGVNHIELSKNSGLSELAKAFGSGGSDDSDGAPSGIALPGSGITTYSAGFDASWELDLFGGNQRSVEGAAARLELAQWDARDAAVSLAAEVARSYLELRTLQRRETVMKEEIERQKRMVSLQANRARVGLNPETDTVRENADLQATQAQLLPIRIEERIHMHALAVLAGKAPGSMIAELSQPTSAAAIPPAVPAGLPSDLLRRRPDVRSAERRLAAATADVGVSVADLYPKFSLTGAAQLISTALSDLISTDSIQLQGAAQATFPILDFGRRRARVDESQETRQQAYISYQKTVLTALRDVEDALARVDGQQKRRKNLEASVESARRALSAAQARYDVGLADISAVLDARRSLLQQRETLTQSTGDLQDALASLYKALGGGWDDATLQNIQAIHPAQLDAPQNGS